MEILKELSQTKLVVMVTHNPELAKCYSTRIINLQDGSVCGDTMPFAAPNEQPDPNRRKTKKPSMSFWTALGLSLNNLATKKARTILTSFAGSIGIIGIALVLSVSSGFNSYIAQVQQETLTSYPLSINTVNVDMSTLISTMLGTDERDIEKFPENETVTSQNAINDMITKVAGSATRNDLKSFKNYLDKKLDKSLVSAIQYTYKLNFKIYKEQSVFDATQGKDVTAYNQIYPTNLPTLEKLFPGNAQMQLGLSSYYESLGSMFTSQNAWVELIDNETLIKKQYSLLKGHYPEKEDELLLVVDQYNQISDLSLYMLGLMTDEDISYIFSKMMWSNMYRTDPTNTLPMIDGMLQKLKVDLSTLEDYSVEEKIVLLLNKQGLERSKMSYTFDELLANEYTLALDCESYEKDELISDEKLFSEGLTLQTYKLKSPEKMQNDLKNGLHKLNISGIVRLKDGITNGAISGSIAYTSKLKDKLIETNNNNDLVKDYVAEATKAPLRAAKDGITETNFDNYYFNVFDGSALTQSAYLQSNNFPITLNVIDKSVPTSIAIYPVSFETKDDIIKFIEDYNAESSESQQIKYNDLIGVMMSSITTIINAITYVLIAFVSISLIVSSIMIGIITYISVLERTKEIGILRSIGASKRDVKTVFNAETIIIGFVAGLMGIGITLLLNIPINLIISSLASISNVAQLPIWGAVGLIAISTLLTTIAGLVPAGMASKKDPVIALRTE